MHWSGAAYLFGWIDKLSAPPTQEVLFGAHGNDLSALGGLEIDPEGDIVVPPRFAQVGDTVGVVYGLRRQPEPTVSEIAFQRLSPTGDLVGDRAIVGVPAGADGEWQWWGVGLASDASGFFLLGANQLGVGLFRARFGVDGSVTEAPTEVKGFEGIVGNLIMAARPTGGFVGAGWMGTPQGAGGRVFLLDAAGELAYLWTSEDGKDFDDPRPYTAPDGRIFVLSRATDGPSDSVQLREFGCTP